MHRFRAAAVILLAATVSGCASSGAGSSPRAASPTPWIVPPQEHHSQRLMRVRLESAEGRGRFRLLLRLEGPERYQIRATHPLFNRRLWSLDVDGRSAVLVDHHQRTVCRYEGEAEIGAIPLGPFPFESLPSLLLGYLPLPPSDATVRAVRGALAYDDALGRRWTVVLAHGAVARWEVTGEEVVTWEKREDWYVLEAKEEGLDLRWKETLREPLTEPVPPLEVPGDYPDGPCDLGWLRGVEDAPWEEGAEDGEESRLRGDD